LILSSQIVETACRVRSFLDPGGLEQSFRFVRDRWRGDGGFRGHTKDSDLYYTLFGTDCLIVLGKALRLEPLHSYLSRFGLGEGLDLVHLGCLVRCWTRLAQRVSQSDPVPLLLERMESKRAQQEPSVYGAFLVWLAYEEARIDHPNPNVFLDWVQKLRCAQGGVRNDRSVSLGNTASTAAAIVMESRLLGSAAPQDVSWLLERQTSIGGFVSHPKSPYPDLLSTAVAVFALREIQEVSLIQAMDCVDFVEGLWSEEGSFQCSPWDETKDVEYTFYGFLALGGLL